MRTTRGTSICSRARDASQSFHLQSGKYPSTYIRENRSRFEKNFFQFPQTFFRPGLPGSARHLAELRQVAITGAPYGVDPPRDRHRGCCRSPEEAARTACETSIHTWERGAVQLLHPLPGKYPSTYIRKNWSRFEKNFFQFPQTFFRPGRPGRACHLAGLCQTTIRGCPYGVDPPRDRHRGCCRSPEEAVRVRTTRGTSIRSRVRDATQSFHLPRGKCPSTYIRKNWNRFEKNFFQFPQTFWTCDIEISKPLDRYNMIVPTNLTSGCGHVTSSLASLPEHSRVLLSPVAYRF